MVIKFTKMHGAGNDFVVLDDRDRQFDATPKRARDILDRRRGIGADQFLIIRKSSEADFEMRIYNADGSEVEMCGNGIRCAAIFARSRGIVNKDSMEVKTLAGIIRPRIVGGQVEVDMGVPEFEGRKIPVALDGEIIDRKVEFSGQMLSISCVSFGNPHCVLYVNDVEAAPVEKLGPAIENDSLFPKRVNVEFVKVISRSEIGMRVWERGSGETLACGTGACAAAVVSMKKNLVNREVTAHLKGGDLKIKWLDTGRALMTGPAVEVFNGEINIA